MAYYPILSWPVSLDGSLQVSVNGQIQNIDMATSAPVWGYADNGSGVADADSLAAHIAARLTTHARVTTVTGIEYKVVASSLAPAWQMVVDTNQTVSSLLAIAPLPADPLPTNDIGIIDPIASWTISPVGGLATIASRVHTAGVWHAAVELSSQRRPETWVYEDAESPYDAGARDGVFHAVQQDVRLFWECVNAAHVFRHRAEEASYVAKAGRVAGDRRNILGDLLLHLVRQGRVRIYWGPGDYTECVIRSGGRLQSVDDVSTTTPDDPHCEAVSLSFAQVLS